MKKKRILIAVLAIAIASGGGFAAWHFSGSAEESSDTKKVVSETNDTEKAVSSETEKTSTSEKNDIKQETETKDTKAETEVKSESTDTSTSDNAATSSSSSSASSGSTSSSRSTSSSSSSSGTSSPSTGSGASSGGSSSSSSSGSSSSTPTAPTYKNPRNLPAPDATLVDGVTPAGDPGEAYTWVVDYDAYDIPQYETEHYYWVAKDGVRVKEFSSFEEMRAWEDENKFVGSDGDDYRDVLVGYTHIPEGGHWEPRT